MSAQLVWQEREGGPLVPRTKLHPWYNRAFWRTRLRPFIIKRDILCRICNRSAATIADHIIPWISPDGFISWKLFSDEKNLRGLCKPCHDRATSTFDRGFGRAPQPGKAYATVPTGDPGKQFTSSTVGASALDKAIGTPEELAELLKDIPGV